MACGGLDREALSAALDGVDAAFDRVLEFDGQALTPREQLGVLGRLERLRRRIPAAVHPLINAVARQAPPKNWAANFLMRSLWRR
jgi:hypothetical protein